jgi:hypothetical protein
MVSMYVCFVKHPGSNKNYLFDCTNVRTQIAVGHEVVCETIRGYERGTVVSYPTMIDTNSIGAKPIIEATGAYWPLKKIVRKFGDVPGLLEEEKREIAKQYILEHASELPF